MKILKMRFPLIYIVILFISCNSDLSKEKVNSIEIPSCESHQLERTKLDLEKLGKLILETNPILNTDTKINLNQINRNITSKIDSIFDNYCKGLEEEIEFEKFALVYIYNFKYNHYKCCAPGESELIGEGFMNFNHRAEKDVFGITLKYLLRKSGKTKNDIIFNGFTSLELNFREIANKYKGDEKISLLIDKADAELEKAYTEETNE